MKKGFLSGVFKNADMPGEIMFDVPFIAISGDFSVTIENYLGIISYEEGEIKINTKIKFIFFQRSLMKKWHVCTLKNSEQNLQNLQRNKLHTLVYRLKVHTNLRIIVIKPRPPI